jgi:hypothetical protein
MGIPTHRPVETRKQVSEVKPIVIAEEPMSLVPQVRQVAKKVQPVQAVDDVPEFSGTFPFVSDQPNELVRAILYGEILGRPVSLRQTGDREF